MKHHPNVRKSRTDNNPSLRKVNVLRNLAFSGSSFIEPKSAMDIDNNSERNPDNQAGIIEAELDNARVAFKQNRAVFFCPGPGWPKQLVRDVERFKLLQELSRMGTPYDPNKGWEDYERAVKGTCVAWN